MKFDELIEDFEYSVEDYYLEVFNKDNKDIGDLIDKVWTSKLKKRRAYVYKSSTPEDVGVVPSFASSLAYQKIYDKLKEKEFFFIVFVKIDEDGNDIEDEILYCDEIFIDQKEAEDKSRYYLQNM